MQESNGAAVDSDGKKLSDSVKELEAKLNVVCAILSALELGQE